MASEKIPGNRSPEGSPVGLLARIRRSWLSKLIPGIWLLFMAAGLAAWLSEFLKNISR